MKLKSNKDFPYTFNDDACIECGGKCCTGKSGNIWINAEEIEAIAGSFGLSQIDVIQEYLNKVGNRLSIKERYEDGQYTCIFFDKKYNKCRVYSVRPEQCRCFPFWNYFRDRFEELVKECPGVKRVELATEKTDNTEG